MINRLLFIEFCGLRTELAAYLGALVFRRGLEYCFYGTWEIGPHRQSRAERARVRATAPPAYGWWGLHMHWQLLVGHCAEADPAYT